jgi:hypothetical protein
VLRELVGVQVVADELRPLDAVAPAGVDEAGAELGADPVPGVVEVGDFQAAGVLAQDADGFGMMCPFALRLQCCGGCTEESQLLRS